jgi:hypothetical protein
VKTIPQVVSTRITRNLTSQKTQIHYKTMIVMPRAIILVWNLSKMMLRAPREMRVRSAMDKLLEHFIFWKMYQADHIWDHDIHTAGNCATQSSNLYAVLVSG